MAQNVQSRSSAPATAAKQAQSRAPIQVAQAPASSLRLSDTAREVLVGAAWVGLGLALVASEANDDTAATVTHSP
jgi:hypothetical protein